MKKISFASLLLLSLCYTACQQPEPAPAAPETTQAPLKDGIAGDQLAVVNYEDGSFVGFYEFSPGEVAIRHSQAAPQPGSKNARSMASLQVSTKLDEMSEKKRSLVEIYQSIVAHPQKEVIQRLSHTQTRIAKAYAEPISNVAPTTSLLSPVQSNGARAAASGCSPDYFNDNYGAQWFRDNYVNESRFRHYLTNAGAVTITTKNQSWAKTCAMAGDFATGIHFEAERWESGFLGIGGEWVSRWSYDMTPRAVECWYIHNNKHYSIRAYGYQPCPKAHLGVCSDGTVLGGLGN
ncbi:MAG: hypothetical protein MUD08_04710 [Cytophagales bacterium]|jgi:hypothetical protein|nr:hypothetical protein [Cytophagales bacterium]